MPALAPTRTLNGGSSIPSLGFGTWPMNDAEVADAVVAAVEAGYRLFDTAENYGNERGVGEGIRRSGIGRDEVFVTTKFNRQWHSVEGAEKAFDNSCELMGLDYIDMLMIHWPNPDQGRYVEAVEGLAKLREAGRIGAIGVSNFKPTHLQRVFDAGFVPDVNQIQLDPFHTRDNVRRVHADNNVLTEAWSPLSRGSELLQEPVITALAEKYERSEAQIILRWHTQMGFVAIPKSATPERIRENIAIFDFDLDGEELGQVTALDTGDAGLKDSDEFGH